MGSWILRWLKDCSLRVLITSSLAFPDEVAMSSGSVYTFVVVNTFSNGMGKDHGYILNISVNDQI